MKRSKRLLRINFHLVGLGYIETLIGLVLISGILLFLLSSATYYVKVATQLEAEDYMHNSAIIYGRLIQSVLESAGDVNVQQDLWNDLKNNLHGGITITINDHGDITFIQDVAFLNDQNQIENGKSIKKTINQLKTLGILDDGIINALNNKKWAEKFGYIIQKTEDTNTSENIVKLKITIACLSNKCTFKPQSVYYYILNPTPINDDLTRYNGGVTPSPTSTPSPTNTVTSTPTNTPTSTPRPSLSVTLPTHGGGNDDIQPTGIADQ